MADIKLSPVKNGDLSIQNIADIQKKLLVSLRGDNNFWDKFCSHTKVNEGYSSYEWRKLNITNLTASDIDDLVEGETPDALTLTYVKFNVAPVDYGRHIEYTDKSKKYNFDDVVNDAKVVLSENAKEQAEYRKAIAYTSGTCTMTPTNADITAAGFDFLKDLLKARTILKKNHVSPISGNKYGAILTSEVAAQVLIKYKDAITHTSQKESLIDGYLGELGGFILYETVHPAMYTTTTTGNTTVNKSYVLFIGKTEYGMPVQTVAFGDDSVEIINHPLGSGVSVNANGDIVADALNQHGTVGYKVMGFATRILFDEAVIRAEYTNVTPDELTVADANRDGYVKKETSPTEEASSDDDDDDDDDND